jgi:hypothetical protein
LEESPAGEASLDQISTWDNTCRESHAKCGLSKPLLPTRVIDVTLFTNGSCRLYEPSVGERENYITLSHCWGSLKILTTRKENLTNHKNSMDMKLLPKTFQDAIAVTCHLGVRYIWIDSLCIIQDDLEDWARESSKMASIYQNSYLTLAATVANDGSEGLFKARDADICRLQLMCGEKPDQVATVLARRGRKHDCFQGAHKDVGDNVSSEPLMTRAWVYQERLLSRRLLHFASDEMVWECQTISHCECDLMPRDDPIAKTRKEKGITDDGGMSDRSVFETLYSGSGQATEAESQRWYQLIKSYALLNITKDEDRLPAFSGIASSLILPGEYMAGIRKKHVVRDLLWFSISSTNPRRPSTYLAPSWSWASFMGGVGNFTTMYDFPSEWDAPGTNSLVEIKDIFTVKSTSDLHGRVQSGELKIRGRCIKAKIFETDKKDWIGSEWGPHRLRIDITSHPEVKWNAELKIDTMEDAHAIVGASVTLLALWETKSKVYFLILVKRAQFSRKFRRIGVTTVNVLPQISGKLAAPTMKSMLDKAQVNDMVII